MRLNDEIDPIMFAPCGMNCKVCYKHLKQKKSCKGCLGSDIGKPEHCRNCPIKGCVKEKGIKFCYECEAFPCKKIRNLEKSYTKRYGVSLIDNSMAVKHEGLKTFMMKERERWTCTRCGGIISLHDKECSECHLKTGS